MLRVDALRAERAAAACERIRARQDAGARAVGDVRVCDRFIHREEARRPEEPQLVLRNRAAERAVGIVVRPYLVDRLHSLRRQKWRAVAALPLPRFGGPATRPAAPA